MNSYLYARLNPLIFGLALGILWGISALIVGVVAMQWGYGANFVQGLSKVYIGYEMTRIGSLIGASWGFFDAFIRVLLIAWLYNLLLG